MIDLANPKAPKPSDHLTMQDIKNIRNMPISLNNIQKMEGRQGIEGKNGKTPLKGIDYFTKSDELRIIQTVKNLIPTIVEREVPVREPGNGLGVILSKTEPEGPEIGSLWMKSDENVKIQAMIPVAAGEEPSNPIKYDLWIS